MLESLLGFDPFKTHSNPAVAFYGPNYQRIADAEKADRESFNLRRKIAPDLVDDVASQAPEILSPRYWL